MVRIETIPLNLVNELVNHANQEEEHAKNCNVAKDDDILELIYVANRKQEDT